MLLLVCAPTRKRFSPIIDLTETDTTKLVRVVEWKHMA